MKILQINCVYPLGSTGKIVKQIHKALLEKGEESLVYYGRGRTYSEKGIKKVSAEWYSKMNNLISRMTGLRYGGCYLSTLDIIRRIRRDKPDLVHLHCINGHFVNIYRLVEWLNKNRYKTVITHHAEFMYTANCSHAFECDKWMTGCNACPRVKAATGSLFLDRTKISYDKMKKAFEGFDGRAVATAVSPWGMMRAVKSPIMESIPHRVIYNGVDTGVFYPAREKKEGQENYILHVTAHFSDDPEHAKGGAAVLKLAERIKDLPVKIYVAAGKQELREKVPDNVVLLGNLSDQNELAEYYRSAKLTLVTSKRETFSMPCAESLCCGTPVVGYKAGAPEMISLKDYSEFVEYGDLDALEQTVRSMISMASPDRQKIGDEAMKAYSKETMTESYLKLYGELVWNEKE